MRKKCEVHGIAMHYRVLGNRVTGCYKQNATLVLAKDGSGCALANMTPPVKTVAKRVIEWFCPQCKSGSPRP